MAKSRNWIWYWTPMFIPLMIFGVILTAHGAPLRFDCSGKGTVDDTQSGSGSFRDSSGKILQGNVMIPVVREFDAKLAIEMNGDSGRIFIPNEMVPSINNGSQDGWWSVKNIKMDQEKIVGRFSINMFRKPKFIIDRKSMMFTMKGSGNYSFEGLCVQS